MSEYATGNNNRLFQAADVGSDRVTIINFRENKYLKQGEQGESTMMATGSSECGEDCHFILENVNSEAHRNKRGFPINNIKLTFRNYMESN